MRRVGPDRADIAIIANLTPTIEASEPHDSAVRNVARSSVAPPASIASQPYVRDDRETPLCAGRDAIDIEVIWVKRESEYFSERDWTTQISLRLKENYFSAVIPGRAKHEPGMTTAALKGLA